MSSIDLEVLTQAEILQLQKSLTPRMTKYIPYTPTPKQRAFLLMNDTREILYGGAAGGGKSVAQLMAALQYVDVPGYAAILFRKTYADLTLPGALIDMSREWLAPFVKSGEVKWKDKEKVFEFPSSATLSFGYLETAGDPYRYQGAEFQYIGIDEATHIIPASYRYMHSRLRKPKGLGVPLRFRATSNPGGAYGEYYYERFFKEDSERIFIGAGLDDNPYLDGDEYRKSLDELDATTREQLLEGNWEIREPGDMFTATDIVSVPARDIPVDAKRVRFWDMAATDPKKRSRRVARGAGRPDPDYTVGFKLAFADGLYWVEDIERVQLRPYDTEKLIKQCAEKDGKNCMIRMEQEPGASGEMAIDYYKRKVLNGFDFDGIRSTGSKVERAEPVSAAVQSGKVFISERVRHKQAFFEELDLFPYGANDDTVDGLSGAFNCFKHRGKIIIPRSYNKVDGSNFRNYL